MHEHEFKKRVESANVHLCKLQNYELDSKPFWSKEFHEFKEIQELECELHSYELNKQFMIP